MSLDEFKGIFWWEYFHRLLGRLIGVAFLVPFLWFLARRRDSAGLWRAKLAGIFVLGGLQGALGLVHGEERAGRRSARVAVPPDRAPRASRS